MSLMNKGLSWQIFLDLERETDEMKKKRQDALKQLPDKKDIDKLLQDISFQCG